MKLKEEKDFSVLRWALLKRDLEAKVKDGNKALKMVKLIVTTDYVDQNHIETEALACFIIMPE